MHWFMLFREPSEARLGQQLPLHQPQLCGALFHPEAWEPGLSHRETYQRQWVSQRAALFLLRIGINSS